MPIKRELSKLKYTYPVDKLRWGHCYGNTFTYAALDAKTDLLDDRSSVRYGLRESTNQNYYLVGWQVSVESTAGEPFVPSTTTFAPAYQETTLKLQDAVVTKKFFLPFENHDLRSAHFLLTCAHFDERCIIRSRMLFPKGVGISLSDYRGHTYLTARFPDGSGAVIWGSRSLRSHQVLHIADETVSVNLEYTWEPSARAPEYGLTYSYTPLIEHVNLNSVFDIRTTGAHSSQSHLRRIHLMLEQTQGALWRYLSTSRLMTPDSLLNRAVQWAKVNQLRDQQEYKWGPGFSNNPPSDQVVGRDSVWYLMGSSYYAQQWSRKHLDFWFKYGHEASGKFIEYFAASRDPIFRDDYGLNINDNTPLFIIAAHQYYSLTGDKAFLYATYPSLLRSADYILEQRRVGDKNRHGLVWCTSTETFVRGLCGWRNCIRDYNLSGAVTEVNVECVRALRLAAELAEEMDDELNRERLERAAGELHAAVNKHLSSSTDANPYYYLNINPASEAVPDMTGDLLFPVLFGVADNDTAAEILNELFSERFWVDHPDGGPGGGMRTVSPLESCYTPKADPNSYGLMGGVWPNLALWAARAAGYHAMTDLSLKALRETFLLSERRDPSRFNVVPGEMAEYFNADDLVQRGQPRSTFLYGIYVWAAVESFLGIIPHADRLEVNPVLPSGWSWAALSHIPYRNFPLTILADAETKTLYTTARVDTRWRQIVTSPGLQDRFSLESDKEPFWLVVPQGSNYQVLVASPEETKGALLDRHTGRMLLELSMPAGKLTRCQLP
jgi:glycogen debranching enzyme